MKLDENFWNKYFEVYDSLNELIPYQYLMNDLVSALHIVPGESILDVGSGTGNVSVVVSKAGGVPTGIDISVAGIKICQSKLPNCTFLPGNLMEPLPFNDCAFDKAVSNNVIYAIPPSERALLGKELYRVIKPGGHIVVSNIAPGFKPMSIYLSHVKEELRRSGALSTLLKILNFVVPTLRILRYNKLIRRENQLGDYSFLSEQNQEQFLKDAGFVVLEPSRRVYAGSAVLTTAQKPL